MPHPNLELILQAYAALNAHDLDSAVPLMDPAIEFDATRSGLPDPVLARGRDAVARHLADVLDRWERLELVTELAVASRDQVVTRSRFVLIGRGGLPVERAYGWRHEFRGGAWTRIRQIAEPAEAFAEVGLDMEPLEVALRAIEAVNRRDAETLAASVTPDAEIETLRSAVEGTVYRGREGTGQLLADFDAAWEELAMDVLEVLPAGDVNVLRCRVTGRGRESAVPVDATVGWVAENEGTFLRRLRTFPRYEDALEAAGLA